ncbi:KRAB-A domain-containing protein 2 [Frankliniella fusca]|uniref:KRAB-A domain-containing protein 2 n=1 Tax=Frankliniella fusca TaxID=407009 RepID=A0AAE1H2G8_9NEOP|nr:KRAB-A domain-containing protein 2 [Frankliniella fusca]
MAMAMSPEVADEIRKQMLDAQKNKMRPKFDAKLEAMYGDKRKDNAKVQDIERYMQTVREVKAAQDKPKKQLTSLDRRRLKKYSIYNLKGKDRLTTPEDDPRLMRYFVPIEEMLDAVFDAHIQAGHGGNSRTYKEVCQHHSRSVCHAMFVAMCEKCAYKQKSTKKGIVLKPIIHSQMNSRCQVDLIDVQSKPDGEFRHIM